MGRADSTTEGQQLGQPILTLLPRGPEGVDWCPLHTDPNMLVSAASCCSQQNDLLTLQRRAGAPCLSERPRSHSWRMGRSWRHAQSQGSLSPAQSYTPRTWVCSGSWVTVGTHGCQHSQATSQLRPWALELPRCELSYWTEASPERESQAQDKGPLGHLVRNKVASWSFPHETRSMGNMTNPSVILGCAL